MTLAYRRIGWLDQAHHYQLRERLLHSLVRYRLVCPVYMLLPDHGHFLILGYDDSSDQKSAVYYFRRQWNALLGPEFSLQHQAFHRVLNEKGREQDAFQKIARYIIENPVRAQLVDSANDYPYWGALFPGLAQLDPRNERFWNSFWIEYNKRAESD